MSAGVQELKRAASMQEWGKRVADCRSSGMSVRDWCKENGFAKQTYYRWEKRLVTEATKSYGLSTPVQSGRIIRVNPENLPDDDNHIESGITIRYGDSTITMPAGSNVEAVANLVKALNRHV